MKITTKTNGYTIGEELDTMIKRFEYAASVLFPDWEIEHFYFGSNLDMVKIRNRELKEYADFNITANRVSFNGHTLTPEHHALMASLTHNDECFNGRLLQLVNF